MVNVQGSFTPSIAGGSAGTSSVQFGADISQAPVYLDVNIIPSHSFARLMLALGRVVRMQDTGVERDHSQYQEWVRGEYIKELPSQIAAAQIKLPSLLAERQTVEEQVNNMQGIINTFSRNDALWDYRVKFWKWLYTHDRNAWVVLDPIVSVQPDATFFEAFSLDESTYARVTLPHEATTSEFEPVFGTTNIDFSVGLEREFARTRPYRPLRLGVGADAVTLQTSASSLVEKKIDLPESWVRGLVEVQAALAMAPIQIEIESPVLADILAKLDSEQEKHGPRSLLFDLIPGEPVHITVEPWGDVFTASPKPYGGTTTQQIKVWGRRRLRVLKELLPLTPSVSVSLIDSGMPSFWSINLDGLNLTIGISGWTSQDWAGRARFSALVPASAADDTQAEQLATELQARHSMTPDDVVAFMNVTPGEARVLLQRLCVAGIAMFDPTHNSYRWRTLFPHLNLESDSGTGLEERRGVKFFRAGNVDITSDEFGVNGRTISADVSGSERPHSVELRRDEDGRVTYAQCDCSYFRHHKLRQGPCRHIVATSLAGG